MILMYTKQSGLLFQILYNIAGELNIDNIRFVNKKFNIGNNDCQRNFIVNLFKITVSREIKRFNVLNLFKIVEFES